MEVSLISTSGRPAKARAASAVMWPLLVVYPQEVATGALSA